MTVEVLTLEAVLLLVSNQELLRLTRYYNYSRDYTMNG